MRKWYGIWLLAAMACADADGDGARGGRDCDDADPRVFAGAAEACDGVDNDCNGQIDEGVSFVAWQDRDADGFGDPDRARRVCELPADGVENGDDCDDLNASAFPGGVEVCDGVDNDCSGVADDGVGEPFFRDADGDGHGVPGDTVSGCFVPDGYSRVDDDCDDADPLAWGDAPEVCDGADNDCNDQVDEGLGLSLWPADADDDGWGSPDATVLVCGPGAAGAAATGEDCDDGDPGVHPGVPESTTPGFDDDCDGYVDELQVPTDAPTVAQAAALADPGDVVQIVGTVEEDVDLTGYDLVLAGEGCDRSALLGTGAGAVLQVDGGRVEGLSILGGTDSGVIVSGDVAAARVCVQSNVSATAGGGIRVVQGALTLTDSLVAGNVATLDGGGVAVEPGGSLTARRARFIGNEADDSGGGVHITGGSADVEASVFAGNTAYRDGGGLSLRRDPVTSAGAAGEVRQSTFVANVTQYDTAFPSRSDESRGSAIATEDIQSTLAVYGSVFAWQQGVDDVIQVLDNDVIVEDVVFYRNGGRDLYTGWLQDTPHVRPDFVWFDVAADPLTWDLRLMPGSPLIDAGDGGARDPDGTVADIGAYGGPQAPAGATDGYRQDIDGDGLPDPWERAWGLLVGTDDAGGDSDGDGLDNAGELARRSSPAEVDSDTDGWSDGDEQAGGTDPIVAGDRAPLSAVECARQWIPGLPLQLDGRGAFDPDNGGVGLAWSISPPPGSTITAPASPSSALTSFTPDISGTWRVTLTASDARGSATFTVAITVRDAIVVPDDQPNLAAALTAAGTSGSVALRPGTWAGGQTLSGYTGTLFGLGGPGDVVIEGTGTGSVLNLRAAANPRIHQLTLRGGNAVTPADTHGGGIDCVDANVWLVDTIVEDNNADGNGGGVYASNCPVTLDRVVVRGNAGNHGGGIYLASSYLLLLRSEVIDNYADGIGGGVRFNSNVRDAMTIEATLFQGNEADTGSAIGVRSAELADLVHVFANLTIVDHRGPGPVIEVERGAAALFDSLLMANAGSFLLDDTGGSLTSHRLATWGNAAALWVGAHLEPLVHLTAWPMVSSWVDDGDASNDAFPPRPGSPLLDAGNPDADDINLTRGAIGMTGGGQVRRSWLRDAVDMDGDGLSDGWELRYGLNPSVNDAGGDLDGDGRTNRQEYEAYTLPDRRDTDGDGTPD
jgi:hypothetical protein